MPIWSETEAGNEEVESIHGIRLSPSVLESSHSKITYSTQCFILDVIPAEHWAGERREMIVCALIFPSQKT